MSVSPVLGEMPALSAENVSRSVRRFYFGSRVPIEGMISNLTLSADNISLPVRRICFARQKVEGSANRCACAC
jgi:hypothetical protein